MNTKFQNFSLLTRKFEFMGTVKKKRKWYDCKTCSNNVINLEFVSIEGSPTYKYPR